MRFSLFSLLLEKNYKLCTPCKKVVQLKLYKEKELLLRSKLLQSRTSTERKKSNESQYKIIKSIINRTTFMISAILILLVAVELYEEVMKISNISITIRNCNKIISGLCQRIFSIVKAEAYNTFPELRNYSYYLFDVDNIDYDFKLYDTYIKSNLLFDNANNAAQKTLGAIGCILQIIGHLLYVDTIKYVIVSDLLWSLFVMTFIMQYILNTDPIVMTVVKVIYLFNHK